MNASSSRRIRHHPIACGLGVLGAGLFGAAANAQILADCHIDYSDQQGNNNWYYGYFNGNSDTPWSINDFEQLPIFNGLFWTRPEGVGGYWTRITMDGGHPNGTITTGGRTPELNWAVRRWVSPGDYVLNVEGHVWDAAPTPGVGNGIISHIQVDGQEVWTGIVENGNEHGVDFNLRLCVVQGTIIDFAIDPRDGNDIGDDTGCHAMIRTVIDNQPQDDFACAGGTAVVRVLTIPGDFQYQWRFNGAPITVDGNLFEYHIANLTPDKVGMYDCVITDTCGSMISDAASVTICNVDLDCNGVVSSPDFFLFLDVFFSGAQESDFNKDGLYNSQDFFDFLAGFFVGC